MSTKLVGQTLLNQFRVDEFIDAGGMGAVYRVRDLKRNVPLAMKVLHADLAEDPSAFKRFKREANALKKLAHPNIVPFYGIYQTTEFTFLLERYIKGASLKEILRRQQGKPLTTEEVLTYLKALSAALGYAHANGVVHCDVKPGNVMIDQGGNIYLTDFGIARHSESTTTTLAATGTAAYMAPEQIRGEPVSPSTDVYGLGVMLYEMLTGQKLFRGDERGTENAGASAGERIRYAHLMLQPPDPRKINPELNEGLASVIRKALNKDAKQRFLSTHELFTAACKAVNIRPELVLDQLVLLIKPDSVTGGSEIDDSVSGHNRWGRLAIVLLIVSAVTIIAVYMVTTRLLNPDPHETKIILTNPVTLTQISANTISSIAPELVQSTIVALPVIETPIPYTSTPITQPFFCKYESELSIVL
jgi:serine/threonine protein kinase